MDSRAADRSVLPLNNALLPFGLWKEAEVKCVDVQRDGSGPMTIRTPLFRRIKGSMIWSYSGSSCEDRPKLEDTLSLDLPDFLIDCLTASIFTANTSFPGTLLCTSLHFLSTTFSFLWSQRVSNDAVNCLDPIMAHQFWCGWLRNMYGVSMIWIHYHF